MMSGVISQKREMTPDIISVLLAILAIAVYTPVWRFDFVTLDDPLYVSRNPVVAAGLTWQGVAWAFSAAYAANWHPLTWISHMADVALFGLWAGGHHLTSLALHLANTLLLFWLLRRMTGALWRSALVAALFAVHPLHVESVAWISERKDVLSATFGLLAIWAYVGYVRARAWRRYALVAALFAAALMAKPMLVTLPFVLLLLDWWPLRRTAGGSGTTWRSLALEKVPLLALSALSSVVTVVAQAHGGAVRTEASLSATMRAGNAAMSYLAYVADTFWPAGLAAYYPLPAALDAAQVAAGAALLGGMTIAAVALARRRPYLTVGWCWFAGMLVPVIGLVQVGGQAHADRYMYLPLVGLLLVVVWGGHDLLARWPRLRPIALSLAILSVGAASVAAHRQVQYWRDGFTLWQRAVDAVPDNYRAHASLGVMLAERGQNADAIAHLQAAVRREPDFTEVHRTLARLLHNAGDVSGTLRHLAEVVRLTPDDPVARNDLASLLATQGRIAEALPHFEIAVRLRPDYEQARFNLALALAKLGRLSEARDQFAAVLRLNPNNEQARIALDALRGKT
jgi:tetratricopeptide (TPR) repeat protein